MHAKEFDLAGYREVMTGYLGPVDGKASVFFQALDFAVAAHSGQKRKSGDPYILHPCSVARILVEEMDVREPEILAAALLHDTVEDVAEVTTELIGERFGHNVEAIVDGCTKIIHFSGDKQTFYRLVHRKIFSGAAARLEVMLVKLADRLHNLRTLDAMPRDRRQKVADETLDIYAPMARVMGLFNLKRELYDLALRYKFPRQSSKVLSLIRRLETDPIVIDVLARLRAEMKNAWITGEITARAKGLWGYFDPVNKVLSKAIDHPLEFIVIVNDIQSCYRILGLVNQNYPPIPRTIRDFIANPKPTGYQGLHARANIRGHNFLFKIRTPHMARNAQRGILKGWSHDTGIRGDFEKTLQEMFDLLGTEEGGSAREMIAASGKKELYTYTPKGDRICLPFQSIVLDFAFQVHSEVGNRCIGAKLGRERVGPEHVLRDGDRVKILTLKEPVLFDPHLQELCKTPRARSGLAKGFRSRRLAMALEVGKEVVQQELERYGFSEDDLYRKTTDAVREGFGLGSIEALLQHVGEGKIQLYDLVAAVHHEIHPGRELRPPTSRPMNRINLATLDPASIKFSACCKPVPTQRGLVGLLSERGISVHQKQCERYQELKVRRQDAVEVQWRLKETRLVKPQHLFFEEASRNRLLMLLAVAPEKMMVSDIVSLSTIGTRKPAWEVNFEVEDLAGLKKILEHFTKSGLVYEFGIDQ